MTDTTPKPKKRPDYTAYVVPERENASWIAIGAAWSHEDGEGFSLRLDLIPDKADRDRIVIRKVKAKAEEGAQ
jgi:hypothetical protein